MKPSPRTIVWLIIGLVLVGLLALMFRPQPVRIDIASVERGSLTVTVDAEGKTRLRQRYIVSAPVAGRVERIDLEAGDTFERGGVVARIDPLPLDAAVQSALAQLAELRAQREGVATMRPKQQALRQAEERIRAAQAARHEAEARVEQAEAALAQAQRELQRAQRLEAIGAISREAREGLQLTATTRQKELEAARLEAQRTLAEVKAAQAARAVLQAEQRDPDYLLEVYGARMAGVEADLAKLRDEAARTDIRAPVGGRVMRVLEEHERVVEAGMPLLELGNLDALELVIDVLSTEAVSIRAGAKVLVEHWGGDRTLTARVRRVEPSAFTKVSALGIEEQRVNVIADLQDAPPALGDGFRIEARIVIWEAPQVLRVPVSALFRCGPAWCVFVVVDGRAQRRRVDIGHRNDIAAEVERGLEAGDTVIVHPSTKLTDGARVEPWES
jgi:HlyD family secretion protein